MEWLGWAFAAATALLLTIFIFLYLHQNSRHSISTRKVKRLLESWKTK